MPHDGNIMSRPVSKLIDLDIDEVSVVDRGANQHSLIAFSKSLQSGGVDMSEEPMADDVLVFDEAGQEVAVDELEHGDTVFDSEGNEYVFVEDGDEENVEKAVRWGSIAGAMKAGRKGFSREMAFGSQNPLKAGARAGRSAFRSAPGSLTAAGAGLAAAGGGAVYGADKMMKKSLGDSIIEELSKAVTDADRDEVIAKALDEVEVYKAQAAEALAWAEQEHDTRVTEAFISKAAEYNLPVSPEVLGPILKAVAEVLTEEELDVIDEIFNAVGDALYEEIGYIGESSNSSVMDQVDAMANEYVGKSDFSHAQLTTAMFSENPSAYDAYISEMGR
jgi:hypothetical protein